YENECFYIMTDARSGKMRELEMNPKVALCGELFNGPGVAENIGHVLKEEHAELMKTLRVALAEWYSYGNVNEKDPNTIILKIKMTDGMVVSEGLKYNFFFK
ncbi:MAG: pyridoxamine 5'-phosphate oxidase family protein, partial [Firmicutes bacterium]|nr:pyridoxamine 5'-phosphate oxidase family protein [Bacillota bacterium]